MKLRDSRRLIGRNVQTPGPAAVAEVDFEPGEDPDELIDAWRESLSLLLGVAVTGVRRFKGGAALCLEAAIDELYAATDINEWAIARATAIAAGRDPDPIEPRRSELLALRERERNPALSALADEAAQRELPLLWDEDEVILGAGARARIYPMRALPHVDEVPWGALGRIPIALITGTNGKTTCARLVARIAKHAGKIAGLASTSGIRVDEVEIEPGDWTGPGAARRVLRRPEVQLAVLETARGGLLRRGLAVDRADAALITNVAADHLGDYGIDDVAAMVAVKSLVARVVPAGGKVVLGAEDPALVELAPSLDGEIIYFARDPHNEAIASHREQGGEVWYTAERESRLCIVRARGEMETRLIPVDEIPITFGGAAGYNVLNALASAALAHALALPYKSIIAGLRSFQNTQEDNPGRGNLIESNGIRVLLDYGHNPEGIRAVMSVVRHLRSQSPGAVHVVLGQPGDRTDDAFMAVVRAVMEGAPDRIAIHEMPDHLRGRTPGEVPEILRRDFVRLGVRERAIGLFGNEVEAVRGAISEARAGDLIVVLPHVEGEAVLRVVRERAA